MLDLVCLGTVTIDIYYKGESLTASTERFELAIGGKYYADSFYEGLGGGGANVAIGTTKLGLKSALVAKIGKNTFKSMIIQKLDEANVRHKNFCQIEEEYVNISSVLLNKKGEKTIINYRTPHQHIIETEDDYINILKAKSLYMANLAKVPLTERIDILNHAKKHDITTFANLNVSDCRRPIEQIIKFLKHVNVFIINSHEFADMVKVPFHIIDFHQNQLKKYNHLPQDLILIVTDGKKGSYGYTKDKVYHQSAVKVDTVVDTTGAGDGFTAGFIAEYIKSGDIEKSMEKGAKYAVKILSKLGGN